MGAIFKNTLISGIAVLIIIGLFTFVQVQDRQIIIAEAENLHLSAMLENPAKYDSLDVSVAGLLLWHPNEPTLFADERAFQELNFERSIQLEMSSEVDFQFASEKPVIASGTFHFNPENKRRFLEYKGVFRVESISVLALDSGS